MGRRVVTVAVHDGRPMRQLADRQHQKVDGLFFVRSVELSRGVVGVDVEAKLYGTGQKVEHQRAIRLLADGNWQAEPSGSFSAGVGVCSDMIVPVFAPRPPDLVDDEVSEGEL